MFRIWRLAAPAILFLLLASPVAAWERLHTPSGPVGFDHAAITHSGDPELDAMVAEALAIWGVHGNIHDGGHGTDIVIAWGDFQTTGNPNDGYAIAGQRARWGQPHDCQIFIRRGSASLWLVVHEVGHCLGFDHSEEHSIMKTSLTRELTDDDAAAMRALYPFPNALSVPLVTHQ